MSSSRTHSFYVDEESENVRLDLFLAGKPGISSRSFSSNLIQKGLVRIDGIEVRVKHHKLRTGQKVTYSIPVIEDSTPQPESISLKIIYEDKDILVVSKPAGLVVHPAHGHPSHTLVNALLNHTLELSDVGGTKRRGIVHRLDKDTSGLMIIAKNNKTHNTLASAIKQRKVKRKYLALVTGVIEVDTGTINVPIGRGTKDPMKMVAQGRSKREAITHFKVVERFKNSTLLEVSLETGRTHQIRVHAKHINHPVVGDSEYGGRKAKQEVNLTRQFLHAHYLAFTHPSTDEEMEFTDQLPDELVEILDSLRKIG